MEIHKLKQNKLFLFFPDNIKFRFIIPSVIIALFMGVLLYLFVSSTISIIIENRIIPKQIKEIVEYKSAKVNSIFEKSITIGKYITSHTGINAFLKDGISQKKMDDELKNELHHIKTYFNLNRIYMASALTQDYYTEDGFLKNIDLSDVENSWFESTLTSKKGYE